jgi:hypothetical protein
MLSGCKAPHERLQAVRNRLAAARLAVALTVGTLCVACGDGYPGDTDVVLTPAEMSQLQRLDRLNAIGRQPYLDARWRYKLTEACDLKVSKGRLFAKQSVLIPLKNGRIVKSTDRVDKSHDVHLQQSEQNIPLLESATWVDSVSFFSLVSHLQRDCIWGDGV